MTTVHTGHRVVVGALAYVGTLAARGALEAGPPGGVARWTRTNHRGEAVSLLEGPAVAAGLLLGGLIGAPSARAAAALTCATAGGAAFGLVDDLHEDDDRPSKGLRGHLGALSHGRLTTGGLKVLGIGATSLVAAALATGWPPPARRSRWAADVVASGALIAASANLVNLLDLRPGRALKAGMLAAAPLALRGRRSTCVAAAVVGVIAAAASADLDERDMLGDGGANALGAAIGTAVVLDAPRSARLAVLAGLLTLTVASEKVSFTAVIEQTPVLRRIDGWGRRRNPDASPLVSAAE
jgi:UDP-N-acetylmuramyl pentapeptide phosphotransferase/UDP-N-acetylglucosamine-1-phosphate transferase